jgi:AraC-like DNA-binding protein
MTLTQYNTRVIEKVYKKINKNFKIHVPIADLAMECKLSETMLTKGFKFLYKKSIYKFQLELAMKYAMGMIKKGAKINDLTDELGYSDPGSFARAFKKAYGLPPRRFK